MLETADMKRVRQRVDAVRATAATTWYYRHSDIVLRVDLILNDQDVQVLWHLENLGGPFPGGMHVLTDSQLELYSGGALVATIPVVKYTGSAARRPRSGLEAFFRQRGLLMPMYPISARLALPAGQYEVRFTGSTHDVTLLNKFIESMGDCYHFEMTLPAFRAAEKMLIETGLITPEVDRLPTAEHNALLGSFDLDRSRTGSGKPYALNELAVEMPSWSEADAQAGPKLAFPKNEPASPEHYWRRQIDAMLVPFREISTCPWGTAPFGVVGDVRKIGHFTHTNRAAAFYISTLVSMYRLTGDQKYYRTAWFNYEAQRRNLMLAPWGGWVTDWAERIHSHVLGLRDNARPLIEFYHLHGNPDILRPVIDTLHHWPYYQDRHHCQMGRTLFDQREFQDMPICNMVMAWWSTLAEVGCLAGDERLLDTARDCWANFFLPNLQDGAYWNYRPGTEPEGKGDHTTNSYDSTMKSEMVYLLRYPWIRELPGFQETLLKSIDHFTRRYVTRKDGVLLMDNKSNYGEVSPIGQLNRTIQMMNQLVGVARYIDGTKVELVQEALRGVYSLRDNPGIAPQQWESAQYSCVFAFMLQLPLLGLQIPGDPARPTVTL